MAENENDPPFHFEIWKGPGPSFGEEPKAIYYVENHNGQCGYGELALDFQIAAKALLKIYQEEKIGNWMAPVAHMIRQTLELRLKALLSSIIERDSAVKSGPLKKHDLLSLWENSFDWLQANNFNIKEDVRLPRTVHLINAFQSIDPSGDLFRFGISYSEFYNKRKSYDRVGINCDIMEMEFDAADSFLRHWDAVVFRIKMAEEMGWVSDPYFDADDFPKSVR